MENMIVPADVLVMAPGLAAAWPLRPRDLLAGMAGDPVPLTGGGWPLRDRSLLPPVAGPAVGPQVLSDEAIAQRADMALRALMKGEVDG